MSAPNHTQLTRRVKVKYNEKMMNLCKKPTDKVYEQQTLQFIHSKCRKEKIEYHYHIYLAFKPNHQLLFVCAIAERKQAMLINNSEFDLFICQRTYV
jgi:hypothetical protein